MYPDKVAVIIPTLDPPTDFMSYCASLVQGGIERIIIIDDGSRDKANFDLQKLGAYADQVVLLKHYVNLGKGRALKNAINYFMNMEDVADFCGLITVDSDGQHSVDDVFKMKSALIADQDKLVLGVRDFGGKDVPFKSSFGNKATRQIFRLLHGVKVRDTQTGLRAISTKLAPLYINLFGERFEYEMNMLIFSARNNIPIVEVPIQTIYQEKNAGTHFRPLQDSFAIYKLLFGTFFKYILSSFSAFIVDILLFRMVFFLSGNTLWEQTRRVFLATIIARIFSGLYNYLVNRNLVFQSRKSARITFIEYFTLWAVQMLLSATLVAFLLNIFGISETIIKILVDSCLFVISFHIQRKLIFKEAG